jgi:hypothetical protein
MESNVIVIPKGFRKTKIYEDHNIKYFILRIESIKYGEIIMWVNKDSEPHHLFLEILKMINPHGIFNSGIIHPKKCYSKKFDISIGLIEYYCVIHPAERGLLLSIIHYRI